LSTTVLQGSVATWVNDEMKVQWFKVCSKTD